MEVGPPKNPFILLHGDLDLWILEACNLPNMDMFAERLRRCFAGCNLSRSSTTDTATTVSRSPSQRSSSHHPKIITSDPYVTLRIPSPNGTVCTVARTVVIPNTQNPQWHQRFSIPLAHRASSLDFHVKDNDFLGAQLIGVVSLPASLLLAEPVVRTWFPIEGASAKPDSKLQISLKFTPVAAGSSVPRSFPVANAYFPERRTGSVTLYQDAHVRDGDLPRIETEGGREFRHERCWEDICHTILDAHKLIYIVGWSIYDKVRLVREPTRELPKGGELTLGELLRFKSKEGVRVLLLVWDDRTSQDRFVCKPGGVMQTHDEETRKFFKHSSVICVLSPRYACNKLSIVKQQGESEGPRQPWHDLHCKIEGPAAYDVLKNFEQRWKKATTFWGLQGFRSHGNDDSLIDLERISWILKPSPTGELDDPSLPREEDSENWHVQIFRSIDSGSVNDFPKTVQEVDKQNLLFRKNVVVDKSIHTAYVKAIRSAQHFVYIENQYFLGSSYGWPSYKTAEADNLIPMELALKIASKIRSRERFAVYVIIPMWPEGTPDSGPVQEILFWQSQTIQMMYKIIGQALKSTYFEEAHPARPHPQDYLNFYCLGNREGSKDTSQSAIQSDKNIAVLCRKHRRFMIYVHAKGMIIDDEYVILGSANINQRSLDGSRDTEIAMGAYQPHHTWDVKRRHPRGQVYGYRISLWAEHLGLVNMHIDQHFKEPHSLECVQRVNKIADDNWTRYTAEHVVPLEGHLLKYPIKVDANGKVSPLPGQEYFPDVGGKVFGDAKPIPDNLTM